MYLHLGSDIITRYSDIIGIFDADTCTASNVTKNFLRLCQSKGTLIDVDFDIPKSFILCGNKQKSTTYISPISPYTLKNRIEKNNFASMSTASQGGDGGCAV